MTKVEYNADLMRTAIKILQGAKRDLQDLRRDIEGLRTVVIPGGAPETREFHRKLTTATVPAAYSRHANMIKTIDDKINGLLAIDRQYNGGELANELGFKKVATK